MRSTTGLKAARRMRTVAPLAALMLTAAACGSADTDPAASDGGGDGVCYEKGDKVEIIVPFGAGGGTDTTARLVAPFLAKAMGIDIQVTNVPGGGSIIGANRYVNQIEPDGDTWLVTSASTQVPVVVGQAGVEFGLDDLTPIAGFPLGGVIYAHADSDIIKDATDLTGEQQSEQFTYAGQPAAGGELRILLIFEMFKSDVNTVLGYDGRGPARVAFEQGESDLGYDTAPAYLESVVPLVEAGSVKPLMTFGAVEDGKVVRDPQFPELPSPVDVYEEAFGEAPSGEALDAYKTMAAATISLNKALTLHADAPDNCKEELRAAWDDLAENEEFLKAAEAELGGYDILLRDDAEAAWAELSNVESNDIEWLLNWVAETYDVRLNEASD
jgi:tripartite-type tricarboxylate transporter receptor subunit TctC